MKKTPLTMLALASLGLAAESPAQSHVSPSSARNTPGNAANGFPFADANAKPRRYLQLHEGVPPMVLRGLAFRVNEWNTAYSGTNTIIADLYVGPGRPLAQTSFFFDRNYVRPKTLVRSSAVPINIPSQGIPGWPGPTPFSLALTFTTPYAHAGGPIVWELVVISSTYNGSPEMAQYDAARASMAGSVPVRVGDGCWVSGQSRPFRLFGGGCADAGGVLMMNIQVVGGPPNTPIFAAFGTSNPDVPFGCSKLHTDLALIVPVGTSNAGGAITAHQAGAATLVLPNPVAPTALGPLIYVQAHALQGSTLWSSSGDEYRLPTPALTRRAEVARIWNNLGGTTATEGVWASDPDLPYSYVGYGLVTEFR